MAWEFISKPDLMAFKCMREIYGENIWNGERKRTDSDSWKIIKDGAKSLANITRWEVGSGSSIRTLADCWILDRVLNRWPTFVNISIGEESRVADLLDSYGNWNVNVIGELFGPSLLELIRGVHTFPGRRTDVPVLVKEFSGLTITAMAYKAASPTVAETNCWLPKMNTHPRVDIFWWRLFNKAIPNGRWLIAHRLGGQACPWGCMEMEDELHLIAGCPFTKQVLRKLEEWGFRMPVFSSAQQAYELLSEQNNITPISKAIFCTAIYHCWRNRNAKLHGKDIQTPTVTAAVILNGLMGRQPSVILQQRDTTQFSELSTHELRWCPPPVEWLVVSVDGTLRSNSEAAVGIIIRNCKGQPLLVAASKLVHWDIGQIEMNAVLFLRQLVEDWMFDAKGIIIEGDNGNVIKKLQDSLNRNRWEELSMDRVDITFLHNFHNVLFRNINRQRNRAAHCIADMGIVGSFVWKDMADCTCSKHDFVSRSTEIGIDSRNSSLLFEILQEDLLDFVS